MKGACIVVRREVIENVGLLDEKFFIFGEEVDWCKRIKDYGWMVFFIPHAKIIHYGGQSSSQANQKNLIEKHKARREYFKKHYGHLGSFISKIIFCIGVFIRSVLCLPVLFFSKKKREIALVRFKLFLTTFKWYLNH